MKKIGDDIASKFKNIKIFAGRLGKKIFKSDLDSNQSEKELTKPNKDINHDEIKIEIKDTEGYSSSSAVSKSHQANRFK